MAEEETKQFPGAFSLLKPSFEAMKLNVWTFLALFAISIGLSMLNNSMDSTALSVFDFLSTVAGIIIAPALVLTQLRSAQEKEISFVDAVKEGLPFVFRLFFLQILTVLAVVIGLVLLIVPGVFAVQRLLLAPFYMIDKDLGIIDAMKASAADSKKYSGAVWGLLGVTITYALLFVTILLIPLAIGLLVAYICAPAIRYYQIQGVHKKRA